MEAGFLFTLGLTGFAVAFLHAAIPTHWLPFVMVGRARRWSNRRTLGTLLLAGSGHVIVTTVLGVAIAWFGFQLDHAWEEGFHRAAAGVLITLGCWLAFRAPHGAGCPHCEGEPQQNPKLSDRTAVGGLFLTLTLSPCELFLPVYLTAVPYGWPGVVWLSSVLAAATLGGMVLLGWLTLRGVEKLRWGWLERGDGRIFGALLCLLGFLIIFHEH